MGSAGRDQLLEKLKHSVMKQSDRRTCLPGTRRDAIKAIIDWYSDDSNTRKNVMWLYGLAGAGKSTVATTIAWMMRGFEGVNLLGAFVFFNRAHADANASTLIQTIAYQLAVFDASISARIEQVIKVHPDIVDESIAVQFSLLLSKTALEDISWLRGPILVVIDALDESGSTDQRAELLRVLSDRVSELPSFLRILVVSRPEGDIHREFFGHSLIYHMELKVDSENGRADVAAFIRSQLNETRKQNDYLRDLLQGWPTEADINGLTGLAAGHFIWAATACRLIKSSYNPREKMEELVKHQVTSTSVDSFASLYELYKTALQSAGPWNDSSFVTHIRDILGLIIGALIPLSCNAIESLLGPPAPPLNQRLPVIHTIAGFGSVLSWSETDRSEPIRILHTSFYNYLTSASYDRNTPWAIDVEKCNKELAYMCIRYMEKKLHENMFNLVLPRPADKELLPEAVDYACKFWIEHVCSITNDLGDLVELISHFMHSHLLHWIEALAIANAYDHVTRSLARLLEWTQVCLCLVFKDHR